MALSPESFDRLLRWLHPDREVAGQEYERIRTLLIRHFQSHRYAHSDDLADATIDRVAKKLTDVNVEKWVGKEKAKYFFRVAFYILLEDKDEGLPETQLSDELDFTAPEKEDLEPKSYCLEKCLEKLSATDRDLIVRYYRGEKATKKENRVKLAQELGIDLPSLRVRALHIRQRLKKCIEKCLEEVDKSHNVMDV